MRSALLSFLLLMFNSPLHAQWEFRQFFDGADTLPGSMIEVELDVDDSTWMIGTPEKILFDSAFTMPNALATKLAEPYPANDTAEVILKVPLEFSFFGILAVQWMQKLDYERNKDGGRIFFSPDEGITWESAFTSPYVYNLYGFEPTDLDTLDDGALALTGTDSLWRNVWFCLDLSFLWALEVDTLHMRFTHTSDSLATAQEGWMIDNVLANLTIAHTIDDSDPQRLIEVTPTVTNGPLRIDLEKQEGHHVITAIEVIDSAGRIVQRHGISPVRYAMDLSDLPNGLYRVQITTNFKERIVPIVVQH